MSDEEKDLRKFKRARIDQKVMLILKKSYENIERNVYVKSKRRKSPYKVDFHAWKFKGLFKNIRTDIWVKLYKKKVNKDTVKDFAESLKDVMEVHKEGLSDWAPDHGFLASNVGFDPGALELAKEHNIFCMEIQREGFDFVGKVKPTSSLNIFLQQMLYFIIATFAIIVILYIIRVIFL